MWQIISIRFAYGLMSQATVFQGMEPTSPGFEISTMRRLFKGCCSRPLHSGGTVRYQIQNLSLWNFILYLYVDMLSMQNLMGMIAIRHLPSEILRMTNSYYLLYDARTILIIREQFQFLSSFLYLTIRL